MEDAESAIERSLLAPEISQQLNNLGMATNARAGPSTANKRRKSVGSTSTVQKNKHRQRKEEDKKLSELETAVRDFVGMLLSVRVPRLC